MLQSKYIDVEEGGIKENERKRRIEKKKKSGKHRYISCLVKRVRGSRGYHCSSLFEAIHASELVSQ